MRYDDGSYIEMVKKSLKEFALPFIGENLPHYCRMRNFSDKLSCAERRVIQIYDDYFANRCKQTKL